MLSFKNKLNIICINEAYNQNQLAKKRGQNPKKTIILMILTLASGILLTGSNINNISIAYAQSDSETSDSEEEEETSEPQPEPEPEPQPEPEPEPQPEPEPEPQPEPEPEPQPEPEQQDQVQDTVEANDDTDTTPAGQSKVINVLDNDITAGGDLTIVNVSDPPLGSATVGSDKKTITYIPANDVSRNYTDTFTYSISSVSSGATDSAAVTVSVVSFISSPAATIQRAQNTSELGIAGIPQGGFLAKIKFFINGNEVTQGAAFKPGDMIKLDGSGSSPSKSIGSYFWYGPIFDENTDCSTYAANVNIKNHKDKEVNFIAPPLPVNQTCSFNFSLFIYAHGNSPSDLDDLKSSYNATADISITEVANDSSSPQPPVAIAKVPAGEDISLYDHKAFVIIQDADQHIAGVELNGADSFDPDGGNITKYTWKLDKTIEYSWKTNTSEFKSDSWASDPCLKEAASSNQTVQCPADHYRQEQIDAGNLQNDSKVWTLPDDLFPSDRVRNYYFTLTVEDDDKPAEANTQSIVIYLDPELEGQKTQLVSLTARSPTQPTGQPPSGQPPSGQPPSGQPPSGQPPSGQPQSNMQSQLPSPKGLKDIESPDSSAISSQSPTNNATVSENFLVYQNATFAVKMLYPLDWSKVENDTNTLDRFQEIVSFYSPNQNSSDRYAENVGLKVSDLGGQNSSLDDYLYDSISFNRANSSNFRIIEATTNTTLAAKPAYTLVYDHVTLQNNTSLQTMEIGTIIGNKLYVVSFNAEPDRYPNYYSAYVLPMINSLEITNSSNTALDSSK